MKIKITNKMIKKLRITNKMIKKIMITKKFMVQRLKILRLPPTMVI